MYKIKLLFNPHAGQKSLLKKSMTETLPEVLRLLKKYQIPADAFPTKHPGHASDLARSAKKEGYSAVVVIGGDGTANEAANGLVDSPIPLGIIPNGTFMNIARMLSIPLDLEKAVELLKINRIRKIDVGVLTALEGKKLNKPYYFIESSGIGTDAHVQHEFKKFEKGSIGALFSVLKHIFSLVNHNVEIKTGQTTQKFLANSVIVANGPYSGASLELAPDAKLNDHHLTVVIYKHKKHKLFRHFFRKIFFRKTNKQEITIIKAKNVVISSEPSMLVHADADLFGKTPVLYKIKPACLNVICGFPENPKESTFKH